MKFRPCIDIHNGKVKQIVGGSLKDEGNRAQENFVSGQDAAFYARLYREKGIRGGHIILLNSADSEYYKDTNVTNMVCFHGRYKLGDEHNFANPNQFDEWYKKNKDKVACIMPLYLLDHSGLAISIHDFKDPWDSGQVGYVYILKDGSKVLSFWRMEAELKENLELHKVV